MSPSTKADNYAIFLLGILSGSIMRDELFKVVRIIREDDMTMEFRDGKEELFSVSVHVHKIQEEELP